MSPQEARHKSKPSSDLSDQGLLDENVCISSQFKKGDSSWMSSKSVIFKLTLLQSNYWYDFEVLAFHHDQQVIMIANRHIYFNISS